MKKDDEGWILIHRKIQDSMIWTCEEPFDMRSAWIDLLMMANHADQEMAFDYKKIIVRRGSFVTSVRKLSRRWGWGKDKTLKYLRLLESASMIRKSSNARRTLLTIENYGLYQDSQDTDKDTKQTLNRHRTDTAPPQTKNGKNGKNKNIHAFPERDIDYEALEKEVNDG